MYMMTWNEEQRTIFTGIGGAVTLSEARVLGEELGELLQGLNGPIHLELDASRTSNMGDEVLEELERIRFVCAQQGVHSTFLIHDSFVDAEEEMCPIVRAILESDDDFEFEYRIAV